MHHRTTLAALCAVALTFSIATAAIDVDVGAGEAQLWHLYHSGFLIKTSDHLLVFDYWPGANGEVAGGELSLGYLDPKLLAGENVVVFVSHDYYDHWYRNAIEWRAVDENIHFVVPAGVAERDDRYRRQDGAVTVVGDDTDVTVDGVTVRAIEDEERGLAFFVQVDGLALFHSGDHASWNWADLPNADEGFVCDDLAAIRGEHIDIAMMVCEPRLKDRGWGGILAFAQAFQPGLLVPAHLTGDYGAMGEFEASLETCGFNGRFWRIEERGDHTLFSPATD